MAATADEIIDRRQLRKQVSFWRIAAFVVAALALVAVTLATVGESLVSKSSSDHVAKVKISGTILDDEPLFKLLEKLGKEDQVKAVIFDISSPGGSTLGGEAHYQAIRALAEKKPVVATVGTLAASAGYMIAAATDHIVSRRSSIVGSIGVLFQYADATELFDKIGVDFKAIKSSPLKAEPNPFTQTPPEAEAMIRRLIEDSYEWFVDLVAERRNMSDAQVRRVADGSIFTGAQALELDLVDEIGGEEEALAWLEKERDVSADLKVVERKPKRQTEGFLGATLSAFAKQYLGLKIGKNDANKIQHHLREHLPLDGLVSKMQILNHR